MNITDKRCFIIEFNFSNGRPLNCYEDVDGKPWGYV